MQQYYAQCCSALYVQEFNFVCVVAASCSPTHFLGEGFPVSLLSSVKSGSIAELAIQQAVHTLVSPGTICQNLYDIWFCKSEVSLTNESGCSFLWMKPASDCLLCACGNMNCSQMCWCVTLCRKIRSPCHVIVRKALCITGSILLYCQIARMCSDTWLFLCFGIQRKQITCSFWCCDVAGCQEKPVTVFTMVCYVECGGFMTVNRMKVSDCHLVGWNIQPFEQLVRGLWSWSSGMWHRVVW
jgi:hypothetical protein